VVSAAFAAADAPAQSMDWLAPEETIPFGIDSGLVQNTTDEAQVLFAAPVHVEGANWLRVVFEDVTLPGGPAEGESPFIRLTSALDGAVQTLNRASCLQWRNGSAYFNGDGVLVELVVPPHSAPCRLVIREARRMRNPSSRVIPAGRPTIAFPRMSPAPRGCCRSGAPVG